MNATRRHTAADGSFARSASSAAGRGLLLIGVAVLIGIVLLRSAFDDDGGFVDAGDDTEEVSETTAPPTGSTTATTAAPGATATTAAPPGGAPATHPPNEVKVLVANAAGVSGAAGRASETLGATGFTVLTPGNAGTQVEATAVYATAGYEADAAAVATALGAPTTAVGPLPDPPPVELQGAHVLVMLGTDIATRT